MTSASELNYWLMTEGRLLGNSEAIVDGYAQRLCRAGVPLARANIAQIFANPLLIAWGLVWQPEGITRYDVPRLMLDSPSYIGGPFEYVLTQDKPLHKSLRALDPDSAHAAYTELAGNGGTDLFANVLEYGDGSRQGCTYVTNAPAGFGAEDIALIHDTRHGLAAALEPVAMRSSTESLLQTYIGDGPAKAVVDGTIIRGERAEIDAVVMFADMRGFTKMSDALIVTELLDILNRYFDIFVTAIRAHGGDVLKLMGDGVLALFPIEAGADGQAESVQAIDAAVTALSGLEQWNLERAAAGRAPIAAGVGLHRGSVTYGNIGSPERLDFTVLGAAVNTASRVQDLCKTLGEALLVTSAIASSKGKRFDHLGMHSLRGIEAPIGVFRPKPGV